MVRSSAHIACPRPIKETANKALIRPKIEYCSTVWDPHTLKDINKLEMVQHRAARFVTNCRHRPTETGDYISITEKIKELGWADLQTRRENSRLVMLYRVIKNLVEVPAAYQYHPNLHENKPPRGHQKQFVRLQPNVSAFKFFFLKRTAIDWNNLDEQTISPESICNFMRALFFQLIAKPLYTTYLSSIFCCLNPLYAFQQSFLFILSLSHSEISESEI